ncbi:MAG: hypothetical protein ABI743_07435, partial [bacterium]
MPLTAITLSNHGVLALPEGFVVLYAHSGAEARALREAIEAALVDTLKLSPSQARVCVVHATDPVLAFESDPLIREQHWHTLLAPFGMTAFAGEGEIDPWRARMLEIEGEIARLERARVVDAEASREAAAGDASTAAERAAFEHELQLLENELHREMRGFIDVPNAAAQVARLGETQAGIRGEYLTYTEQRKEMAARRQQLATAGRGGKREIANKMILGGVFILLGILSLLSTGVQTQLKPMGWLVIVGGAALLWQASKDSQRKESPKEAQLTRQEQELEGKLIEIEARLKEADLQVKQFCARVGCTSPGQVVEL